MAFNGALPAFDVRVRTGKATARVALLPDGEEISFEHDNGWTLRWIDLACIGFKWTDGKLMKEAALQTLRDGFFVETKLRAVTPLQRRLALSARSP